MAAGLSTRREDAYRLKLELTETFAPDDVGTGDSSLAHPRQLPLDMLKIARSFVLDLLTNQNDAVRLPKLK